MARADGNESRESGSDLVKLFDPLLNLLELGGDLLPDLRTVGSGIGPKREEFRNVTQRETHLLRLADELMRLICSSA